MKKIKRLNDYKITSGGYIFDLLDRSAQKFISDRNQTYCYWLTAGAHIRYLRQSTAYTISHIHLEKIKRSLWKKNKFYVTVLLMDTIPQKPIAIAKFTFVGKNYLAGGAK